MERKKALADRLAALGRNERHKLYKEAARLRRDAERRRPAAARGHTRDIEDEEPEAPKPKKTSLDDFVLRLLETTETSPTTGVEASVLAVRGPRCLVEVGGNRLDCTVHVGRNALWPAVGDVVEIDGERIVAVRPRRTFLSRSDPGVNARDLVVVANVDLVVVVISLHTPPFHPRLIDRYWVAIQQGGAQAAVCLNKIDLAVSDDELAEAKQRLAPYESLHMPVVTCSAARAEGLAELRTLLAGKTAAFVGHSGVGKTSILNALLPELALETKTVHHRGQGRHTTTASTVYEVGRGTRVIDTPGIRSFGLRIDGPRELAGYFPEFDGYGCRFGDCTHLHEPACGVKDAVLAGKVDRARYDAYRRLAGDASPDPTDDDTFACRHCGETVASGGAGSRHRNHCPRCLHSLHLDADPGDRASGCGGLMEPVSVWVRKGGEWAIIHRCRACGRFASNRIAADDNEVLLMSLAVRPLAQPPFPLDRL